MSDWSLHGTSTSPDLTGWRDCRVDGCDLAIDAYHLSQIAEDQRDFNAEYLRQRQERAGLSSNEAADFLGVSLRAAINKDNFP